MSKKACRNLKKLFYAAVIAFISLPLNLLTLPKPVQANEVVFRYPNAGEVIINELMWPGSSASTDDEWIELKNTTQLDLNLSGCYLTKSGSSAPAMSNIPVSTIIAGGAFYVVSNYNTETSSINIAPNLVDPSVSLSNTALQIRLYCPTNAQIISRGFFIKTAYAGTIYYELIDTGGNYSAPLAGSNVSPKKSMERNCEPGDGALAESWHTAADQINWDEGAAELGTPGHENSTCYHLAALSGCKFIDEDGDQTRDDSEPTMPGWKINLSRDASLVSATTTSHDGCYKFTDVKPGHYAISEEILPNYTQVYPAESNYNVTVAINQDINNLDFGNKVNIPQYNCADPIILNFETDAISAPILKGQIIDSEYADWGITISAENNDAGKPDLAVTFDSDQPSGDDPDNGTPNTFFGGPGIGNGGVPSNDRGLHNHIVIAHNNIDANIDGLIDDPDDEPAGGSLFFNFNRKFYPQAVTLIDIDHGAGNNQVVYFNELNDGIGTTTVPVYGDNNVQILALDNTLPTKKLQVALKDSFGLDELALCPVRECNNGYKEGDEACDLGQGNGMDCTAGYGQTCQYCSQDCTIIEKPGPHCGDNVKNGQEDCDGQDGLVAGYECTECQLVPLCVEGQELVLNGGFEAPIVTDVSKWDIYSSSTVSWGVEWVSDITEYQTYQRPGNGLLELQRGLWTPVEGSQYAELDSDWNGPVGSLNNEPASILIYQDIPTVPGRQYELAFKFSPRPGTDINNNVLEVSIDGTVVDTISAAGGSDNSWAAYDYKFIPDKYKTRIQFKDLGAPDSFGTFLDQVSAKCLGIARTYCGDAIAQQPNDSGFFEQCDGGEFCAENCTWLPLEPECPPGLTVKPKPMIEYIDLGETLDGPHQLSGWSDNRIPGNYGGYYNGGRNYRQVWEPACTTENNIAYFSLHFGTTTANKLILNSLDGISELDSYSIYYQKDAEWVLIGHYPETLSASETWLEPEFNLPNLTGDNNFKIVVTDPEWVDASGGNLECDTFGQVSVSWIKSDGYTCERDTSEICGYKFYDTNQNAEMDGLEQKLSDWTITLSEKQACAVGDEWADSVITAEQGLRKDGTVVLAERSVASKVLGPAEQIDGQVTFYSLGFGGEIIIRFENLIENGVGDDIYVYESTWGRTSYPLEKAGLYASQDNIHWQYLKEVDNHADFTADLGSLPWARYLKLIDTTDKSIHADDGDGFDLDGVKAINCVALGAGTSVVTTENGYCFHDVSDGRYLISETLKDGFVNTTAIGEQVTVGPDNREVAVNFGNWREPVIKQSICGYKFNDTNGDGLWHNETEPALAGLEIKLAKGEAAPLATNTNGHGYYCFYNLEPGAYKVYEAEPAGWVNTTPTSSAVVVSSEELAGALVNFGNFKLADISGHKLASMSVSGDNQTPSVVLMPVLDWVINLVKNGHNIATSTTNLTGDYSFTDLGPGLYQVAEQLKDGWEQLAPLNPNYYAITALSGGTYQDKDFINKIVPLVGCQPGNTRTCATGQPGVCSAGQQTCTELAIWGSCVQTNQASAENCSNDLDDDCDGNIDSSDSNCALPPVNPSGGGGGGGGLIGLVIHTEANQEVQAMSAVVSWFTNLPSTSRVVYDTVSHPALGVPPNYGYAFSSPEDATKVTFHSVVIDGLTPGVTYYWRPISAASPEKFGEEFVLTTAQNQAGEPVLVIPANESPGSSQSNNQGNGAGPSGARTPLATTRATRIQPALGANSSGAVLGEAYIENPTAIDTEIAIDDLYEPEVVVATSTQEGIEEVTTPGELPCNKMIWLMIIINCLLIAALAFREKQEAAGKNMWLVVLAIVLVPVILWYPVCWLVWYLFIIGALQIIYLIWKFYKGKDPDIKINPE